MALPSVLRAELRAGARVAVFLGIASLEVACGSKRAPRTDPSVYAARADAAAPAGGDVAPAPAGVAECTPARTSEKLPARVQVTSADATTRSAGRTVFFPDLFGLFKNQCGSCHVDAAQGNFRITLETFASKFEQKIIDVMKSDDPAKFMPPPVVFGKPYSQRPAGDPVRELVTLLELWVANGKTTNPFVVPTGDATAAPVDEAGRYLLSPDVGAALTNLGNCIPSKAMIGTATAKMDELDAFFAKATELPERLAETDFVALDSETLARHGVVSFAPGYPLWSDAAGKMRHVRVPRGKAITFDKATQQFTIPDNTRFYKTFLKHVVDRDGNQAYRKIETRLIVSRRDSMRPDGSAQVTALFGSYVWNEDETEAVLQRQPLHDGKPFTDLLLTYVVDEPKVEAIKASNPPSLTYALNEGNPGVLRKYAIPGSGRCIECHMGSPDASFSLGFTPLQIRRRPTGEGGNYEATGEDELTQLERLIDYGLVTGLAAATDVLPLEESQGTRKARTPEELKAQAYMLGNCAACHNPRGFPSVKNRELRDLLNFLPSATTGGIFEFPLDRVSPRIKRGQNLDEPIPYITPSLRDLPRDLTASPYSLGGVWQPKWWKCTEEAVCKSPGKIEFIDAPWRSLIYRNVDGPFGYSDDFAIFPHMPRSTPGFDCRVPRIMGDWMVSIPAKRKKPLPETSEDSVFDESGPRLDPPGAKPDVEPQPYVEVKPGDPAYATAVADAKTRLETYRAGRRYNYCPDTTDIVDRRVKGDILTPPDEAIADEKSGKVAHYPDNVPDRPHWIVSDLTDPPSDWIPRRFDWDKVLVPWKLDDKWLSEKQKRFAEHYKSYFAVLEVLNDVRITPAFREFALKAVPFGLWTTKPECQERLAKGKKVSDYVGAERPAWMDRAGAMPEAPVYPSSPGAAVFNMICVSCHGPQADARGIQAETLADLTGGDARVANLRDGLLGTGADGKRNIDRVFGPYAGLYPKGASDAKLVTADDWAGRYVAWMALGGTEKSIPVAILNNVGATRVMGQLRKNYYGASASANMLQAAAVLCRNAIPHSGLASREIGLGTFISRDGGRFAWGDETALVDKNGDADMWLRLCSFENRPVVRVAYEELDWQPKDGHVPKMTLKTFDSYYWADGYPADAEVMNQDGKVEKGVKPGNYFAICARRPSDPVLATRATEVLGSLRAGPGGGVMPFCPESLFAPGNDSGSQKWRLPSTTDPEVSFDGIEAWAARGSINAGLAVMLYLDQIQKGQAPTPRFDQCQELK